MLPQVVRAINSRLNSTRRKNQRIGRRKNPRSDAEGFVGLKTFLDQKILDLKLWIHSSDGPMN